MADDVDTTYAAEVLKTLYRQALNGQFTDFTIRAGNKTVRCHRAVLSTKSDYFASLCSSGMTEAVLKHAKEEDEHVLDSIVRFLYLGRTNITVANVESLLLVSDFLKHAELKDQCEKVMVESLNLKSLKSFHGLAKKEGLSALSNACERLSMDKFAQVSQSDWFLSLSLDEVDEYLKHDDINTSSEDQVIDALLRWLNHSRATDTGKESYVELLFPCIRLPFCSKSKLDDLSKDASTPDKLRLKILEYMQHGLHRDHRARKYYSPVLASNLGIGTATALPPASAPPPAASDSAIGKVMKTKITTTATNVEERILIMDGKEADNKIHKDIMFFDPEKQPHHSIITQAPSQNFAVCGMTDSFIASGGTDFSTGTSTSSVKQFSFASRSWSDLPDLLKAVSCHGSAYLDGRLYTLGGCLSEKNEVKHRYTDVNVLDLATQTWIECQPLPLAVGDLGIAVVDTDILALAGNTGKAWSAKTFKYNSKTGKWTECREMPKTGSIYRSTAVVNRQVFVLTSSLFLQYDVPTDTWTELPLPIQPSSCCAMVVKEGRLFALGGFDKDKGLKKPNDRVQTYDLARKTWRLDKYFARKTWKLEKYTMPVALVFHKAIVVNLPATK